MGLDTWGSDARGLERLGDSEAADGVVFTGEKAPMSKSEAEEAVIRLKDHVRGAWYELTEIHDRKGWRSLGYTSFETFVAGELGMSRAHAYRLMEGGRLLKEMEVDNNSSTNVDALSSSDIYQATEAQLRELRQLSEEVRQQVSQQIEWGKTSMTEIREMASEMKGAAVSRESSHQCDRSEGRRYCPYCGEEL